MIKKSSKVINLGCRLNFSEAEVIKNILSKNHLQKKIVVNTCAVTNQAVQKSIYEINKVAKTHPDYEIIVTGCASQVDKTRFLNLKNVRRIVDNRYKTQLFSYKKINGIKSKIECDGIINAAGPWSGKVAKLINQNVELQLTRGCGIFFSGQLVNKAINRCRIPNNNDIMCPSEKESLWGTTSNVVSDPESAKTTPNEIQELLSGAEELFPNIRNYKSFRTWSGIRPLVKPKKIDNNVPISRGHKVIDHEVEGFKNFLTVCGGALTTHRLMAEDVVNKLGNKFGLDIECTSHLTTLLK